MAEDLENNRLILRAKRIDDPSAGDHCTNLEEIDLLLESLESSSRNSDLFFDKVLYAKDIKFIKYKVRQLKKKKYRKVLNGCVKIIRQDCRNIWAYLIAGAACRKYEKHKSDAIFYFTQVLLLNPNFLTAWVCLLRSIQENSCLADIDDLMFKTMFIGLLKTEKKTEKWCDFVKELIEFCSLHSNRRPLEIISPLIYSYGNSDHKVLLQNVSGNILDYMKKTHQFSEIEHAVDIFKLYFGVSEDIVLFKKILAFAYYNGFSLQFKQISDCVLHGVFEQSRFGIKFFHKFCLLYPTNYLVGNKIVQEMHILYPEESIKRKHLHRFLSRINFSFGDFRTACDNYLLIVNKSRSRLRTCDTYAGIYSLIKLRNFNSAWESILKATKSMKKRLKRKKPYLKRIWKKSFREIWLHLLTHGPSEFMKKLGVIFCLKLLRENNNSQTVLYYACIGCIGLGERDLAAVLLKKLLKIGAIYEVLFIRSLMEETMNSKNVYLKELPEFAESYETLTALSYNFEIKSKAFKSICKASVLVPYHSILYEWLGIYFYDLGDFEKSEKYFEFALFHNPTSWVAINYYSSLLAKHDMEASKMFLDSYRTRGIVKSGRCLTTQNCNHLIALKAGLFYMRYNSQKYDFYKACENLRWGMRLTPRKRHFIEMLGESYSLFGMVGVGIKWLKECYIVKNKRNIYAGSQLGKQYLFTRGVRSYSRMMRSILYKGGLDTFISLHNAAHAFLLRMTNALHKNNLHLSQIFGQIALFMCVRSITVYSNFPASWKLLGDILYYCGNLSHTTGYLFVPHWLLPGSSSSKIVLIRRFQAIQLGIRCYYAGLNIPNCSQKMKASLWNSIAVSYGKIRCFCPREQFKKIVRLAIDCCLKALAESSRDSLAWNTLGVLLKDYGSGCTNDLYSHSSVSLSTSMQLSKIVRYRFISAANLGFLNLSYGDYEKAYNVFLSCRGTCTSLDFPWIGQIFINIINGYDIEVTLNNILFLYKYTYHFPPIHILFTHLLLLSRYYRRPAISRFGKKYKKFCSRDIFYFDECVLSSIINVEKNQPELAKMDLCFALRTCVGLKSDGVAEFNEALNELNLLQSDQRFKLITSALIRLSSEGIYSFFKAGPNCQRRSNTYISLLKLLNGEEDSLNRKTLYLALSVLNYRSGNIDSAKYYFLQAKNVTSSKSLIYKDSYDFYTTEDSSSDFIDN